MKKKLIYQVVYDEIENNIRKGVWKPGEKIPTVQELADQLDVGISSVREAIRILSQQKILRVEQGRGTFVEQQLGEKPEEKLDFLEKSSIEQLTNARLIIEPELAALVAEQGTEEEAKQILKYARIMQKKFINGKDFLHEDIEFHHTIAKAAKNEILLNMIMMIDDLLYESRRHSMKIKSQNEKAVNYHVLIAKAIYDKNPSQARRLMKAHILDLLEDLNIN
ncbi:FadR/GntR family transcriptional regulator [Aquibacillus albus]|uniref:GntR family transcriptional repressor for pyruvate dehydrogenase complex n=1 Tax=Aquibacillus albus TaxID=1168171 RepID=A0ABS2MYQ9_9BACI|nr:FadR/GntR family transcriptional regulator [Aquibacillus albus]MBM7571017.1 GntR family transcriptional repressor for pyruvate dehydrogenase complex [Aquibacillus albus]